MASVNSIAFEMFPSVTLSNSDSHTYMRQFIGAASDYSITKSEASASQLNRCLQLLGFVTDLSIYDPHSSVVAEFYVSLYQLMSNIESRSQLLWGGISILETACKNHTAHYSLIHTYNFLPILSRVLCDQQSRDKKERLLKLTQELTYGIRIMWQEPYISRLISTIVKWIKNCDQTIIYYSLGVLINLCHKNLPCIYTLIRCVDIKTFLRSLTTLEGTNIELQVGKLFIIFEKFNGEVLPDTILRYVQATFKTVVEVFQSRDYILLRHIVDFFLEIKDQINNHAGIIESNNYRIQIEKLLEVAENLYSTEDNSDTNQINSNCVIMVFEFLQAIIQLNLPEMISMHCLLAKFAMNWLNVPQVSSNALMLLRHIAVKNESSMQNILQPLTECLPELFLILNSDKTGNGSSVYSADYQTRFTSLLYLIREMVKCEPMRANVLTGITEESVRRIFSPLLGTISYDLNSHIIDTDSFSNSATCLYINALALVDELSTYDEQWKTVFFNLLEQKQVHMVIAHVLCKGDVDTKVLVFKMARSRQFPSDKIANVLFELQSWMGVETKNTMVVSTKKYFCEPFISQDQEERLDNLILKLQEVMAHNQIGNVKTSDIMELFEYKIKVMSHAETSSQMNLEVASKQITDLQQRVAQMSIESSRLHQLIFHIQRCQEEHSIKLHKLQEDFRDTVKSLEKSTNKCSELDNQLKSSQVQLKIKMNELKVQEERNNSLSEKYKETLEQKNDFEQRYCEENKKNNDLGKALKKMEDRLVDIQKKLEEKTQHNVSSNQKILTLSEEIEKYKKLIKQNEALLAEKDKECEDLQTELKEYKSKLDWIMQISMNKIKSTN